MKGIKLVRLDYRLIHGQVITKWNNKIQATDIIIIDNDLVKDDFMLDIYIMAAPPGVKVKVVTQDQFIANNLDEKYDSGSILVLLKKVSTLRSLTEKGFVFPEVQIGGLGGGKDRRQIVTGITVSQTEVDELKYVKEEGTNIYFQVTPEEPKINFEKVV